MLATALISWVGVVYFFWHKKRVRNCFIWVSLLAVVFLSLPGRAFDLKSLRRSYVASLRSYEDVKYVWGGENRLGVDCSGLIRAGLVRANLLEGLRTLNPRLVRNALFLWWNDSSARALGEEHQQLTRHIMTVSSINELDESKILPGDFAVTVTGVHALAYAGDGIWIEADPHFARVITVKTPTRNPWFEEPVQIMRWSQIEETENSVGR